MWLPIAPALALEPGELEVLVERTTEEMHWFKATALSVEYITCTVGIPTDGEGEPLVGCSFPAGPLERSQVPRALAGAARQARRAVRQREGDMTDLRVTYLATERRVWLCDHVQLPNGLWSGGRMEIGLVGGSAHPAVNGYASGGGEALIGCNGRPIAAPIEAGRSILAAWFEQDPVAQKELDALLTSLPAAVAALPPTPSAPTRPGTVPSGFVMIDGRPVPGGGAFQLYLPTDRTVGTRVTWTLHGPNGPEPGGVSLVSGFPEDWSALAGPVVPEGYTVRGTLEVFATDEPPGPEWTPERSDFERLHTAALPGPRER